MLTYNSDCVEFRADRDIIVIHQGYDDRYYSIWVVSTLVYNPITGYWVNIGDSSFISKSASWDEYISRVNWLMDGNTNYNAMPNVMALLESVR